MKKICVVTAARSEYGVLKWLMQDIDDSDKFILQLVVTGGHLSYEQGHTVDQIIEDGFYITYTVDTELDTSATARIAESMGKMGQGFAKAFEELKPDYVLILGDRYELLPICSVAFVMRIPIIHLSGGDVTEGAIDDGVRNAVTMLADYHFSGTEDSAKNIIRMRNSDKNVWAVGEPGLDSFNREALLARDELAENLGMDSNKKWVLMTYHAETMESMEYNLNNIKMCIDSLLNIDDVQTIITYANADFGGIKINEYIENKAKRHPEKLKVVSSLGHFRYLSFMKQAKLVIGNSSSGIIEAPFLNIPVINIGNRQKGRYLCDNIIQCESDNESLNMALEQALSQPIKTSRDGDYWGDGHSSEKIMKIMTDRL